MTNSKCPNGCGEDLMSLKDGSGSLVCLKCRGVFKVSIEPENKKKKSKIQRIREGLSAAKAGWDAI